MSFVVVQSLSCVWLFVTPWTTEDQASLSFTISQNLLKLMSIELMMPSSISSSVTTCSCPQSFQASGVSAFCIRWPKYWSFSFSISPSNEYSGLISFRNDWFDLLVQGNPRVFLSFTVWKHQFFGAPPCLWSNSHLYATTGKTIALTKWIFVGKLMSLLFNMLFRFVIAFIPRSKHLLI